MYKKLYDRWYESVVKNFNKMSDMQEDAYLEMLQPFKNNLVWKTLMPGISGRETLAQHRERPKVSVMPEQEKKRQQEERKKKIETEKAQTQKEENIEAESAQKKARQSEKGKAKLPPPISPASLGAFKYKEVYQIAGYKPWSSRLLIISEPENMRDLNQIYKQAIDAVIDSEKIVRLDDLILLRQKARFWIEEFFNHIISPCQFTTPTILQCDDKFNV